MIDSRVTSRDDLVDRAEPALVEFRIEAGAKHQIGRDGRVIASAREEIVDFLRDDLLDIAAAGESCVMRVASMFNWISGSLPARRSR